MTVLEHMKSMFGERPRLICERGRVAAHLWADADGAGTVCTVGMSKRAQVVPAGLSCPSREPRIELLAFCRVPDAEILGNLLLDLAEYPFAHDAHLFWYQVMPLGRRLVAGSAIEGVLLSMPPLSAEQMTFKIDGHRVDIVWVVPILAGELGDAREQGIQALEERLERENVDIADIRRPR